MADTAMTAPPPEETAKLEGTTPSAEEITKGTPEEKPTEKVTDDGKPSTGEKPPVEDKPAEKPAEKAPEKTPEKTPEPVDVKTFKLALPDGTMLRDMDLEMVRAEAGALGLSEAQAQSLVATRHEQRLAASKVMYDELVADKEVGGDKLPESIRDAQAALAFAAKDPQDLAFVKDFLNMSGLGNNVVFMRMFARVGRALREDGGVRSGGEGGRPAEQERSHADVLFGDVTKKK